MRLSYHVMSSPLGLLFLASSEQGLRYLRFMDRKSIKRMISMHSDTEPESTWTPSLLALKPVVDQLEGYFCGAIHQFEVQLDPIGTPFQGQVWQALLDIPFGETRTYGQIAKAIRQPRASRAVGLANNQNPIAIIVPCHRIVGANGTLTGYSGGLPRKRWLLQHEERFKQMLAQPQEMVTAAAGRSGGRRDNR